MTSDYRKPLVVVTVGGDHHPFDRLMTWIETWLSEEGDRVRCVVQHGSARAPIGAEATPYIDHKDLLELMAQARAVVSSGGPTTLAEARQLGHRPVTVPRKSALGEHVDDHQRLFTTRLHELGYIVQAETESDFRAALASAIDAPRIVPAPGDTGQVAAINLVGELIDATASNTPRARRAGRHDARHRVTASR